MTCTAAVFIATTIDGFIARENGSVDYLTAGMEENPDDDGGFAEFTSKCRAIIMGRNTYDTVCVFYPKYPWSYSNLEKCIVLTHDANPPPPLPDQNNVEFLNADDLASKLNTTPAKAIVQHLGHGKLYIDGGSVIQMFLRENAIDEMIITTVPITLGTGIPLFKNLFPFETRWEISNVKQTSSHVQVKYTKKT